MQKKFTKNNYGAVWVSHSSMGDFIKCPRAYYLKNMWKNPDNNRKMSIVNPVLSLGSAVHDVLEGLAQYKAEERQNVKVFSQYEEVWKKYSGKIGGFSDAEEEQKFKERGRKMIERVMNNMGPLKNKALKLKEAEGGMPPNFLLSEEDNIILCGKIDWLEYVPETDSIKVLDFKTGKNDEDSDSLQLPIYQLLLNKLQKRKVTGASYWYIDREDVPREVELPTLEDSYTRVIKVAKEVKNARTEGKFVCPRGSKGCFSCTPFEMILKGEAEHIGIGNYGQDLYMVKENKLGKASSDISDSEKPASSNNDGVESADIIF